MMFNNWLGYNWEEVQQLAADAGLNYTVSETAPPGRPNPDGIYRVVRIRQSNGLLDIIVAREMTKTAPSD